jgi:7,8-dihydropterin-6-yl-methyl-4-(beta-D-ribofuranosyl)aminobenzene 5'-phosphate synthase
MMRPAVSFFLVIVALCTFTVLTGCTQPAEQAVGPIRLSVVFDNIPGNERLQTAWGYACLVEGYEKNLLFDTGGDGGILLANMRSMEINPGTIDTVLLSHSHGDHTNGLEALCKENPEVTVYLLDAFPEQLKRAAARTAACVVAVDEPVEIVDGVTTTGRMGTSIAEESLILETRKGLVVLTGCAHPGIVAILEKASELSSSGIHLVMGGFHLPRNSKQETLAIIERFRELGVQKVAASHCTGDEAIALFREAYGEDFVETGCGAVIDL